MSAANLFMGMVSILTTAVSVSTAGGAIRFPSGYKSHTLYASVENEKGNMIRDVYADDAIIKSVKAHQPLPPGGVITMPMYHLTHEADGVAIKDDKGHFLRGDMFKIFVMQRRAEDAGWAFAAFSPEGLPDEPKDTSFCTQCHGGPDAKDGLFTMPQLLKLAP